MIRRLLPVLLSMALCSPAFAFTAGNIVTYSDTTGAKVQDSGIPGTGVASHVATLAALQATTTATYPNGVWRDDYSAGLGAPPLRYAPSGSVCSLNGGNGDNGSQVKSADGKCWLAVFPSSGLDVREFGAVGDNSANDTVPIQNAINALPVQGGTILFTSGHTFKTTSTLNIGNGSASAGSSTSGVILKGDGNPAGVTDQLGPNNVGGPIISYTGSGDAIAVLGPLSGWGVQQLYIKCTSSASSIGLHVISASWGDSRDLSVSGCATQISSNTVATKPSGYTVIDALHNNYKNVTVQLVGANSVGVKLGANGLGSPNSDTDFNEFDNLTVFISTTASGTVYGVILEVCDDNILRNVHFVANGGSATIKPYYFDYSVNAAFPTSNVIDTTDPAMLGCGGSCGTSDTGSSGHNFTNNGSPSGTTPNYLNNLQLTNGATYPLNLPNLIIDKAQAAWTPTFQGSSGGTPTAYVGGQQNGWVTETGYDVTVFFNVASTDNTGTWAGNLLLTSLPVTVGGGNNEITACPVIFNGVSFSAGRTGVYLSPQANTTQMAVGEFAGASSAGALPIADISGGGIALLAQCSYHR